MLNYANPLKKHYFALSTAYLEKVRKELVFTPAELQKCGFAPAVYGFSTNLHSGFEVSYLDVKGNPLHYTDHKEVKPYTVFRYETPPIENGKQANKYRNPAKESNKFWYNGLFAFNPKIDDTMYFVEGQKKAAVLNKYGVPTIGVSGIQGVFTNTITTETENPKDTKKEYYLNENYKECIENFSFSKAVFIYDNDFQDHHPNHHHKDKLKRYNGFLASLQTFFWACKQTNKTPYIAYINPKLGVKAFDDIQDHLVKNAVANDLRNFQNTESLTILPLNAFSQKDLELCVGGLDLVHYHTTEKYLSNDKYLIESIKNELRQNSNVALQAPTGKGKTTLIVEMIEGLLVENPDQKIYLVFPTNSLLDSYDKDFVNLSSLVVNQFLTHDQRNHLNTAIQGNRVVLTTYHSFSKVSKALKMNDLVIFDEYHKAVTSTIPNEFYKAYKSLICRKLHITATPINSLYFSFEVRTIKITDNSPKVDLNLYSIKNAYLAANQYISTLNNGGVNVVFVESKKRLIDLAKEYENRFEVQLWYSCDTIRQTAYYKHFKENHCFLREQPQKPLLVLATSFIYEGVSFLNNDIKTVSIFGESNPQNIVQALKRTRNFDSNTVFNCFMYAQNNKKSTNFVRTLYTLKGALTLTNGTEKDETILSEYENLRFNDSFTSIFNNGVTCYFAISRKLNNSNLFDVLSSEFVLQPIQVYETSLEAKKDLDKKDKTEQVEINEKAFKILTETPQKAINFVYSNTNHYEMKKWLKINLNANFDKEAKELQLEVFELEKYYSLVYKLQSIGAKCQDISVLWEHRSERKSEKFMNLAKFSKLVHDKGLGKKMLQTADFDSNQLNTIYQFLLKNSNTTFGSKKELIEKSYNYLYEKYTEIDLNKLRWFGLGTKKGFVSLAVDYLADFEVTTILRGKRYYKINLKDPKDILKKYSLEFFSITN